MNREQTFQDSEQAALERRRVSFLEQDSLAEYQLKRLNELLQSVLPTNRFYSEKLAGHTFPLRTLDSLSALPFTFKDELISRSRPYPGFAANLTYSPEHYLRIHRTSGTRGRPLVVADTRSDWNWWLHSWQYVLDAADISSNDRSLLAFSFGPFIGFWSAFDALVARNVMVIPAGGMNSIARLELMRTMAVTCLFCTPSYALHLAEVADQNQLEIRDLPVKKIIVAGEPGGSVPAIRQKIEDEWDAKLIDHGGASEVGPWGFADPNGRGLYINESEFIAEFLSVESGLPAEEGELSELILTSLGRVGSPVIRYRTGDLVRPTWNDDQDCRFVLLEGGVLGRTDDMMVIRGVNVFPSSIEQILRSFPEVIEYRMTVFKDSSMDQLLVEVEDRLQNAERIKKELNLRLGLRVDVECVPMGSLPRFEGKGKRFVDKR
ncbi:MAG: phenylacetate--CoA ligase family protein [Pirellulaceae bacterium]